MKNKNLVKPDELEIKLSFHNYKLLKKEEFSLKGSYIYFVKGPNEVGKSSILNALKSAHEIKDDTPQKVTIGEVEGVNEFTIPGADGKIYNVVYEFTDATTKFIVFDQDGNKISKITDMRSIFNYNHIDTSTFLSWSHTAEGRRKQKEMILQLLPPETYIQFKELENAEETAYLKRTEVNKDLDNTLKLLDEYKLNDEQTKISKNLEAATNLLESKEKEYEKVLTSGTELSELTIKFTGIEESLKYHASQIDDIEKEIAELLKKKGELEKTISIEKAKYDELKEKYFVLDEEQKKVDSIKEQLRVTLEKGKEYVKNAQIYREKTIKYDQFAQKKTELEEQTNNLTEEIRSHRLSKEELIVKSKFPVENVSFDEEGYLTINGLRFDEKQTCESDAILIVAQIMCKMNETPIQILGDASLLDYKKLDKLYEIAQKNGKIMFVDEIDRELDKLVIVGYDKHYKKEKESDKSQTEKLF